MADTTFVDGSTVVSAAWLNEVNDDVHSRINATRFGVVGDGTTDDTAAIQAALDAAEALSEGTVTDPYGTRTLGGGIVTLPPGRFKVTGPLTIAENCGLRGAGSRSSIIESSYNGVVLSNKVVSGAFDKFGILLEDFMIIGDRTKASQVGLGLMRTWQAMIKNVHVMNCGSHGMWMAQTLMNTLINVESQRNVGAGLKVTDGFTSWTDFTANDYPSMVNTVVNGHFAYNDAAGILTTQLSATPGVTGVNGLTFVGGGAEYNYRSSAAGVGYNVELLAKNYWPTEFNSFSTEDTANRYHIYVNATDAVFKFDKLRHLSNGAGSYPERCIYVNSGTAILNSPLGTANLYKTTNGSNKPFTVNVSGGTAGIRVIDAQGSLITDGNFVCDEAGSSVVGASAYERNYGTQRGQALVNYVDSGNSGPDFYRTGEAHPFASFSNTNRGLEFGGGSGAVDVRIERKSANILGMASGDTFQVGGITGETLKYNAGAGTGAVATTFSGNAPTGATAGNPLGWVRINVAGTDRFQPYW